MAQPGFPSLERAFVLELFAAPVGKEPPGAVVARPTELRFGAPTSCAFAVGVAVSASVTAGIGRGTNAAVDCTSAGFIRVVIGITLGMQEDNSTRQVKNKTKNRFTELPLFSTHHFRRLLLKGYFLRTAITIKPAMMRVARLPSAATRCPGNQSGKTLTGSLESISARFGTGKESIFVSIFRY